MRFLDRMNVTSKLILMLVLPVIGVVVLSVGATVDRYLHYKDIARLERLVRLAVADSAVVDALQAERDAALALGGSEGAARYLAAQARSGHALQALRELTARHEYRSFDTGALDRRLQEALAQQQMLTSLRGEVAAGKPAADAIIAAYDGAAQKLLDVVGLLPHFVTGEEGTRLVAYGRIWGVIEDAGVEQAFMTESYHHGRLPAARRDRMVALAAAQERVVQALHTELPQLVPEPASGVFARMSELRRQLLRGAADSRPAGDERQWQAATTAHIEALKSAAQSLTQQLVGDTASAARLVKVGLLLTVVLVVGGIALTLTLAYRVSSDLTRHVRELLETMHAFAHGDSGRRMPVYGRDEIGQLSDAFNRMAERVQDAAERERGHFEAEQEQTREFRRVLTAIQGKLQLIAFGDLTQTVDAAGHPELEQLAYHINMMTNGLRELTREMVGATNEIAQSVGQLKVAATAQSAAAMEQATASSQTMTTLEEIRVISGQNRDKAQSLGGTADRALEAGEAGQHLVAQSVEGMELIRARVEEIGARIHNLNERTRQIESINDAVANVAQQSKMLALNAAIEAAKAGTAGKGFTAVASEVKSLAERSNRETVEVQKILKDIRQAIRDVVQSVEVGGQEIVHALRAVEEAGSAMSSLGDVTRESAIASKQIVAAVRQETTGITQLAAAVAEINKATGQFADSTRQTEGAAENLGRLTRQLQEHAGVYEV